MKGNFFLWLRGSVRIRITGSFCERFLNLCAYHDIRLWDLKPSGNGYEAGISLKNFRKIKPLVKKSHVKVRILRRRGLPFRLFRYRKRKMLFGAVGAALFLIFFLAQFIWDVEIAGNHMITDEKIMDYLEAEDIHQGIRCSAVDCKKLAADLRQQFQEFTWVSVRLQGTRLMIDLQENTDIDLREEAEYGPSSLVADVDGTVVSIITRAGTPAVKAGDEVKKGDLLVSGCVELTNDSDEVYERHYVAADADVLVQTQITYRDQADLKQEKKVYTGKTKSRTILRFGSFSLGIPFFGKQYSCYDSTLEEKQLRLMENFYLPVYFKKITVKEYEIEEVTLTPEQVKTKLETNLYHFMQNLQEKGVQIFQNNVKIETTDSTCVAGGTISLVEKTGKRVDEDMTETEKEGTPTE